MKKLWNHFGFTKTNQIEFWNHFGFTKKDFFENTVGNYDIRSEISTSLSQRRRTFRRWRRVNFCLRIQKHVLKVKKKSKTSQIVVLNNFCLSRIWQNTTFLMSFKNTLLERRNFHFFSTLKYPTWKTCFNSLHIDKIMQNYWQYL